ncbi:MAG TPA: DUF1302 family protein, partial [Burkholderiaceae bacterium]|nr:DUF1302 family protein [Burkholderiaceae bacterium]
MGRAGWSVNSALVYFKSNLSLRHQQKKRQLILQISFQYAYSRKLLISIGQVGRNSGGLQRNTCHRQPAPGERMRLHPSAIAAIAALSLPAVKAFEISTPDPDLKARLDLTPKFSAGYRLKDPSPALTGLDVAVDPGTVNEDDGDHNFNKGLVSRRFDLLAELDVSAPNYGARLSGTAWYDGVYLGRNDYRGTARFAGGVPQGLVVSTANNLSGQAPDEFLPATRRQHGRGTELLDAFGYLKGEVGGLRGSVRFGRHTLQWGESLFFGQNGIANAQGPIDIAKIVSVPGWQFKEVLLPVEQVSGTVRLAEGLQAGAYYQLKWRKSKLPGVGSYFSNQDYIGGGRVN